MCTAATYSYNSGCSATVNIPAGTATTSYVLNSAIMPVTSGTFVNYPWCGGYGYHAPKCVNCGYCSCCGRSDMQKEDGPVPGSGSSG